MKKTKTTYALGNELKLLKVYQCQIQIQILEYILIIISIFSYYMYCIFISQLLALHDQRLSAESGYFLYFYRQYVINIKYKSTVHLFSNIHPKEYILVIECTASRCVFPTCVSVCSIHTVEYTTPST